MEAQFASHLKNNLPYLLKSKILLAVSGGVDSMVLLHLCKNQKLDISVAHCNFRLRREESEQETTFVKQEAHRLDVTCHIDYFDTYAFAKANKVSTQMAARELRYTWFQELAHTYKYDYILTAHHLNDTAETLLINLSRGSGIKGLTGIPRHIGNIVRPLLGFSRKQIQEYATAHNLQWKEDSSNALDHYVRNHLRHHAIPALEKANPNFLEGVAKTQYNLSQTASLLEVYKEELKQALCYPINSIQGPSGFAIDLEKLETHKAPAAVLYTLLQEYGFTAWEDIYSLKDAQSGKQIHAQEYTLLKDRSTLQLLPRDTKEMTSVVWIQEGEKEVIKKYWTLSLEEVTSHASAGRHDIYVRKEGLQFPLQIRSWQEGDYFFPLGLGGKKKLSKFFKDEKLSLADKQEVKILCSGNDIVWVIGMRPDNRFKVTQKTQTILKISYKPYEV